uniref:protein trichome birefringence-like n=1 Tax=Erigeron canadensis TaxID=72917 RepID=UPI001CB9B85D|nr:protein trichome birefringence-like [Erigeron canadensis]
MAESTTKYMPVHNGFSSSQSSQDIHKFTNIFSLFKKTKKTKTFAYIFISIFIAFTVFLAFNPSPNNPSSPWFSNIFSSTTLQANSTTSSSSIRSHFSSIYSYLFNSTVSGSVTVDDTSFTHSEGVFTHSGGQIRSNQSTHSEGVVGEKKGVNQTVITHSEGVVGEKKSVNQTRVQNVTHSEGVVGETVKKLNQSVTGKFGLKSAENDKAKNEEEEMVKKLVKCDMFDGEWVKDESYPLYKPGSCSLIDEQFNCYNNGRPDKGFQMLKWKPKACTLPRLDGSKMLQMLKGKRLVFVGDSLNRNMWESLICILKNSVKDQTKVYEASGRHHFRSEPSYSFVFKDYNCTVEFFVAPFIVRESETKDKNGTKKETLRLDLVGTSADQYKQADIIVFNTGHWWTHEKTSKGKDYYQEGSHVYNELNVLEAFRKAMTTWGRWVDAHINPSKTLVFFRGYSASHFRGGQWNSGGQCDNEVEPIKNTTYLSPYPDKMKTLEKVLRGMKTRVSYLNITRLTDFRKDGHPSIYRKQHYSEAERRSPLHFQDCSHWCLPGVPDSWNEILYAQILAKQYQNQQQKN